MKKRDKKEKMQSKSVRGNGKGKTQSPHGTAREGGGRVYYEPGDVGVFPQSRKP